VYKHILIPLDGSAGAEKAIEAGIELADRAAAKVTLFTAVPECRLRGRPGTASEAAARWDHERASRESAQTILLPAAARLRAAGIQCDTAYAESNRPHAAIIDAARARGCDLIIMSSRGRSGLSKLWYGSETRAVLRNSTIPTLVYR
jgi:nucleotide-binding universal stress UspA family protein